MTLGCCLPNTISTVPLQGAPFSCHVHSSCHNTALQACPWDLDNLQSPGPAPDALACCLLSQAAEFHVSEKHFASPQGGCSQFSLLVVVLFPTVTVFIELFKETLFHMYCRTIKTEPTASNVGSQMKPLPRVPLLHEACCSRMC